MMEKFSNILEQFSREVFHVAEIFHAQMHAPPCSKNQPPVAGGVQLCFPFFILVYVGTLFIVF